MPDGKGELQRSQLIPRPPVAELRLSGNGALEIAPVTPCYVTLTYKRPNLRCGATNPLARSTSTVWRQPVKLDYFRVADHTPGTVFIGMQPSYGETTGRRGQSSAPMREVQLDLE